MKRKHVLPIVYISYLLIFSIVSLELLLRTETFSPSFDLFGDTIILDRKVLYTFKRNSSPGINSDGYRDYEFQTGAAGRRRCLFLGDSFIMGLNVISKQTIPKELERILGNMDVYNMGVHGYGPDQSLIRLLGEGIELHPDQVILGLFPANDFSDIIKNHLFEIDQRGGLIETTSNPVTERIPAFQLRYLIQFLQYKTMLRGETNSTSTSRYVFSRTDRSGEAFYDLFRTLFADTVDFDFILNPDSGISRKKTSLMKLILQRYRDELNTRGISFLVVVIPSYTNIVDSSPFQRLNIPTDRYCALEDATVDICRELEIDVLDLYPLMTGENGSTLFNDVDQHLTPRGTSFAAQAIKRHLDLAAHVPPEGSGSAPSPIH